jgi:hypothetical protein
MLFNILCARACAGVPPIPTNYLRNVANNGNRQGMQEHWAYGFFPHPFPQPIITIILN